MVLNITEDILFFTTVENQLYKVNIVLDGTDPDESIFEHVYCEFHAGKITGLDVCMKKQQMVSCSGNKVCIWNYADRQLLICHKMGAGEETLAVAFHPSGFHIIVAVDDKIVWMNVCGDTLKEFKQCSIRNVREIRFSHGGQYFACTSSGQILIYNFYREDCPPNHVCKGHSNRVRGVRWSEDDFSIATCG